jgi:transmembrane sensor
VTRRPSRSFSVRSGDVTVRVVGTTFAVEVVADRVGVSVEHGVVEVDWGLGRKQLVAGERGWFPPLVLSGDPQASERESEPEHQPRPADPSVHKTPPARGAASSPGSALGAQELLAEVDAARSRGEPQRAVELLREILREHPADPRTPLAAFTLGRMLLNELGRPSEAAAAFHEVRRRAPSGQFAEDALAREVEAWSRASEPGRARALAKLYLERYPSGRHARRVQALSGLK